MSARQHALMLACALTVGLAAPVSLAGQDGLAAARQLYASAEYDDALRMLDDLLAAGPALQDRQSIELYRIYCLVALADSDGAMRAIEATLERNPLFRPDEDTPPRVRAAFTDARKRLLPRLIQESYVKAKAAFDAGDFKTASAGFALVLMALSDPDITFDIEGSSLADLRVLAQGFQDLTLRALAPPPMPAPPPAAPTAAPAQAVARPTRIYTAAESGIVQPVVVRQEVPDFPGRPPIDQSTVLEVVIDERGAVQSAVLVEPMNPRYARMLLDAARTWTYQPARLDGEPVKFLKRIQITVSPSR